MQLQESTISVVAPPSPGTETITYWSTAMRLALALWTIAVPLVALGVGAYWMITKQTSPVFIGALFPLLINHVVMIMVYAFFASQNPRLRARGFWMASFIVAAPVSTLLYWFLFVWPAPRSRRLVKTFYPG